MVYEIIVNGFDGSTDETNKFILWVQASDRAKVDALLKERNMGDCIVHDTLLPDGTPGIDFVLED
jgi:hypothetical protein